MNVLIIDDEKAICDVLKLRLEQEGMICMTATSIEEATTKSRLMKFDILIADVQLSGVERGDVFAREYRRRNPRVNILIISGSDNTQLTPGLQANKIFSKPIELDMIVEEILQISPQNIQLIEDPEVIKLDDRDAHLLMELVNKVVEHTNIVATTQSLITENIEELATSQERVEDKITYIYTMLKAVDDSGILKMYSTISGFLKQVVSKLFWTIVVLGGMYIIKGPLLVFVNTILHK